MRISDWSSDVCSSDLLVSRPALCYLVRALMGISGVRIRMLGRPPCPASCIEYGARGRKMGLTHMRRSFTAAVFATGLLAGCASQGDMEPGQVYDPLEPANRMVFAVNETLDTFVLQPTAYL